MRQIFFTLALGTFVLAFLTGCAARKLDEKLDAEYSGIRTEVDGLVIEVDTMVAKMRMLASEHDKQDVKIDNAGLSFKDQEMQTKHKNWVKEYYSTLDSLGNWVKAAETILAQHDSLEATHETIQASKIKLDHELMLAQLTNLREEGRGTRDELLKADSIIHTFFYDHAYLNKKYRLVAEERIKPPTIK